MMKTAIKLSGSGTALLLLLLLSGCSKLAYYAHSANGHMHVMSQRQDISKLLQDPGTDPKLKQQLRKVQQIRQFASAELQLPGNKSYRQYVDLKRPYVVWNVVAAPEFSVEAKTWCFLFSGCVRYRGYFVEDKAKLFAGRLQKKGFDVAIGGVTAYSTLGWFADPVLNTFVFYPDARLAGLIFHELAHQKIYLKGDSAFNESFATTVELEGIQRWLRLHKREGEYRQYLQRRQRQRDFVALIQKYRARLRQLYRTRLATEAMRQRKAVVFRELRDEYQQMKKRWNGYSGYDAWFARELNNAHLASVGTYYDYVPAFQALLRQSDGDMNRFYNEVKKLSKLPANQRRQRLKQLGKP